MFWAASSAPSWTVGIICVQVSRMLGGAGHLGFTDGKQHPLLQRRLEKLLGWREKKLPADSHFLLLTKKHSYEMHLRFRSLT